MKKRLLSVFLAMLTLLSLFPTAMAASSEDAALGEVNIYNGDYELGYLSINGAVRKQKYTYFLYEGNDGQQKEAPAYCVNPNTKGVPQTVGPGQSIKYLAEEKASDPKVVGIISNGYPHRSLGELKLDNKYQAYYATKMALWCYLLPNWNIANLKVAPGLSGSELDVGNRILAAAKDIYKRGTTYNYMLEPRMTVTPDRSTAYPVTIGGEDYFQQVFTVWSETWVYDYDVAVAFADPGSVPVGAKIVDLDDREIDAVTTQPTGDGYSGQFKVIYPAGSIQGQSGNVQLSLSASVAQYRKAGYSKKIRAEHEEEILLHQAAKNAFDEMGVKKLPKAKELQAEYAELLADKKKAYAEYRRSREEMRELLTAKANVDRLLKMDEEQAKEKEKDHGQR